MKPIYKPLAISFILASAVAANADVLLNTFGSTGTGFNPAIGWTVNSDQSMAIAFSVSGTYSLSEIDVALFQTGTDGLTNVNLCSDSSGNPGSILETLSANATSTASVFAISSVSNPILTTGTYYVTLTPQTANSGSAWCYNSDATHGNMKFSNDSGSTWNPFNDTLGSVTVLANPVPEPASIAVLGLGAFALVRRRRSSK